MPYFSSEILLERLSLSRVDAELGGCIKEEHEYHHASKYFRRPQPVRVLRVVPVVDQNFGQKFVNWPLDGVQSLDDLCHVSSHSSAGPARREHEHEINSQADKETGPVGIRPQTYQHSQSGKAECEEASYNATPIQGLTEDRISLRQHEEEGDGNE